jgi:hypothetical protein
MQCKGFNARRDPTNVLKDVWVGIKPFSFCPPTFDFRGMKMLTMVMKYSIYIS